MRYGTHAGNGDVRVSFDIDRKVAWGWGFEFRVLSRGASRTAFASSCEEPQDAPPDESPPIKNKLR